MLECARDLHLYSNDTRQVQMARNPLFSVVGDLIFCGGGCKVCMLECSSGLFITLRILSLRHVKMRVTSIKYYYYFPNLINW